MNAVVVGLAVGEASASVLFATAAIRLWGTGDLAMALATGLVACAALGLAGYSLALALGVPA